MAKQDIQCHKLVNSEAISIIHGSVVSMYTILVFNSLWPSETIWPHLSGSTLTAPSHYLNQCWLIISEVLWHEPDWNFKSIIQVDILYNELENYNFEIIATPRRGQWVNDSRHNEVTMLHWSTYWDWDKMTMIWQTIFSNALSWMKTFKFYINFN